MPNKMVLLFFYFLLMLYICPYSFGKEAILTEQHKEDIVLTTLLQCKLTNGEQGYVRILKGQPYHSDSAPYGFYLGQVPVFVKTQSGREKLFAKEELRDQVEGLISAQHLEGASRALDYYISPKGPVVACVGNKKDVLLFNTNVEGIDPQWLTTAVLAYNPYSKRIERTVFSSWRYPTNLYFGKDEVKMVSPSQDARYKYRVDTMKGDDYSFEVTNTLPTKEKFYKVISLPKSLWPTPKY